MLDIGCPYQNYNRECQWYKRFTAIVIANQRDSL